MKTKTGFSVFLFVYIKSIGLSSGLTSGSGLTPGSDLIPGSEDSKICFENDFLEKPCTCEHQEVDCGDRNIQVKLG
jgi:hypothetical protein